MSTELFSLGELYVSDFLRREEKPRNEPVELKLIMDGAGFVRLDKQAPLDSMWGKYWYRSGINTTMKAELGNIVGEIQQIYKLKENDVWLDIASNDGTLLSFIPKTIIRVGIDPAEDSFRIEAERHSNLIIQDYFSEEIYNKSGFTKPKVITSIAMFYDVVDPDTFIDSIYNILDDNGVWVLQLSYTPLMLKQLAFDNICHEHFYYYNLLNMQELMERHGMNIIDCQINDVNGGSFRIYVMKSASDKSKFGTQPYRDVCKYRVDSILRFEKSQKLDGPLPWQQFYGRLQSLKAEVVSFIKTQKMEGRSIWAYGASTKGNTLLQYFGLDKQFIDGIAERSIHKWGLRTVGTDIPIYSEAAMREVKPDFLLVLPWHFINEFQEREIDYLRQGGTFIVPCPKFKLITYKDV